jgi:capsular polysaccharide biosynthesis protein
MAVLRRRWWVIVLSTLAVVAIAYGIALLRAGTSTAEAIAVVSPGVIDLGPGEPDRSALLAADYAALIPQDDRIVNAVSEDLDEPSRGRIQATAEPGSSLMRLGFTADDAPTALAGARAVARAVSGVGPVSESILPRSITVVSAPTSARPEQPPVVSRRTARAGGQRARAARQRARAARQRQTTREYSAQSVVLVSPGGGSQPGFGDQATRLGPTYAAAIPDDARVLDFVAQRVGTSVDEVEDNSTVENDKDTAVLRMQYKATNDADAEKGARAFADAVTGPRPVSSSVPPGAVTLARVTEAASPSVDPAVVLPVGALLGLALGLILVLALERADTRVDEAEQLEDELGAPVLTMSEVTPQLAMALRDRWRVLARREHPTIALIPASAGLESTTAALGERLVMQAAEAEENGEPSSEAVKLVLGPAPAKDAAGASVAASSDVTVLVAAEGERLADLRATREMLNKFEAPVQWGLLLERSASRSLDRTRSSEKDKAAARENVASR